MQDKKIKKSLIIESRLKLLSLALQHKDSDIVEFIIQKVLEQSDLDKQVVDIITNIEFNLKFNQFEHSINEIKEYLKRKPNTKIKKELLVSEDIEIKELKQKLKSLEEVLEQLVEEKTEYLTNIEEFNTQYNLHLGELLKTILSLRKEILYKKTIKQQKLKDKYEKDIKTYEDTKVTIDEIKETIVQLEEVLENIDEDNEDYTEIKNAYDELQVELETLESELKVQEKELEKAKEFIENEDIKNEYEEAKTHYKQYENEYENVKKAQKENIKLNDEEKIELKKLYKKAAKLCHPDIVPDELKEKAHKIMQELNEAYSKQDLNKIKSILTTLETTGFGLLVVSDSIDDKDILRAKIEEFKENIFILEEEIEDIKLDDTFVTISELNDWDEYFENLINELQTKKAKLEKEASEILDAVEDWVKTIWTWADENNITNGKLSRQKENLLATTTIEFIGLKLKNIPKELCELENLTTLVLWDNDISFLPDEIVNFTNLKKLNLRGNPNLAISPNQKEWIEALRGKCSVFIDSVKYLDEETLEIQIDKYSSIKTSEILEENSDYSRYIQSIENIKFEKIRKYCENLSKDNSTDDMQKYLAQNGKMYKALIYDALEQFISKLDNQTITLIDWGSNQGIASMLVLDYIKEKQFDIKVSQVILVDDDTKILSRAMAQVEALSQDNIQIIAIKNDDDNLLDKIKTNTIALNLFANDRIPIDFKVINDVIYKDFIICLSNENIEFVDKIYNDFNNSTNIQDLSIRDGSIGRYQRYERIFKLIN